ncbi:MAG TPA: hypothetical protein VEA69_00665 [Tepidisphaeraceae bacterium]|nr:hypothetical protein [Tepidisphaeraceae bacterium]
MRLALALVTLFAVAPARAQTADDLTALIDRLIALDSIDIARAVKFRPGLLPALHAVDADESGMAVLKDPYQVHGRSEPGAAGWYRVSFVVPEKLGHFAIPPNGYNLGVEGNCLGVWEVYTYINGKPAGLWSKDGLLRNADQHATHWMSNAPMPTRAGDRITIAILNTASPLGRGSPDGFGLRHLRLRFALAHTGARRPFFGGVSGPGKGTGLLGAREMLRTLKGDALTALQAKLKQPIERLDLVFKAAETGRLNDFTAAMATAAKEIDAALKP